MFEPSRRSATVFIAVKTGAITTSQWFALATRGFSASAVSTAWLSVLYIFQFPAMTGFRISCYCDRDKRTADFNRGSRVSISALRVRRLLDRGDGNPGGL